MNKDFNPEQIALPPELEGRLFLTFEEFGALIGASAVTVRAWARKGIVKIRRFTPRCNRIPVSEVERLKRGELMEPRETTPAP
jgi:predicted site-specific integrase-resolvase